MRRMRRDLESEESGVSNDRWLLTYSDMITLLLALFIIMYGMSSLDSGKFKTLTAGLEKALNPSKAAEQAAEGIPAQAGSLDKIYHELADYVDTNQMNNEVDVVQSPGAVSIHLKDTLLFTPNTADLLSESDPVLMEISTLVSSFYDDINHVTITGNTADLGNRDYNNEMDSWQLSVDRSVNVLERLTTDGLKPDKMSIEGNSHYNPVATNNTEEGRARNRRVEITITNEAN